MRVGVIWTFFSRLYFIFSFSLFGRRYRLKFCLKVPSIQANPVVSGMRTPVSSCYHVYSKGLDKNVCRSIDSDLTSHSSILDSISQRFVVVWNCRTAFPVVFQGKTGYIFSVSSLQCFLFPFNFTRRSASLHFVNRLKWSQKRLMLTPSCFFSNRTFDVIT